MTFRPLMSSRVLLVILLLFFPLASSAADYDINLGLNSVDEKVTVTIENSSTSDLNVRDIGLSLNSSDYSRTGPFLISANDKGSFVFTVKMPDVPGSYPLTATIHYQNDEKTLSMRHVGIFSYQEEAKGRASCNIRDVSILRDGDISLISDDPAVWRLVLPDEVRVISETVFPKRKVFRVAATVTGFRNRYSYFAVAEAESVGRHETSIFRGALNVDTLSDPYSSKGRIPSSLLLGLAGFFGVTAVISLRAKRRSRFLDAYAKYAVRMFFVAGAYYFLRSADRWLLGAASYSELTPYIRAVELAAENLRSSNYEYFFRYFADAYLIMCLLFVLPFFYFLDHRNPLEEDKYSAFMRTLASVPAGLFLGKFYWSRKSRLGILTFMVKIFYIPLLSSWLINSLLHQGYVTRNLSWDFVSINAFLMALFILTDNVFFAFGYLVEYSGLKNDIRSVEPTLLGWMVCLWCYPPFNAVSFRPFDHAFINIAVSSPQWLKTVVICIVTALWGIFAWASISLGAKASNLTNRGIVSSGPYGIVRHPAYTAKLLLWVLQGVFLGLYSIGILLAFSTIYILRAWTEERHLSLDPEYLAYKKNVRWGYIPGII